MDVRNRAQSLFFNTTAVVPNLITSLSSLTTLNKTCVYGSALTSPLPSPVISQETIVRRYVTKINPSSPVKIFTQEKITPTCTRLSTPVVTLTRHPCQTICNDPIRNSTPRPLTSAKPLTRNNSTPPSNHSTPSNNHGTPGTHLTLNNPSSSLKAGINVPPPAITRTYISLGSVSTCASRTNSVSLETRSLSPPSSETLGRFTTTAFTTTALTPYTQPPALELDAPDCKNQFDHLKEFNEPVYEDTYMPAYPTTELECRALGLSIINMPYEPFAPWV